MRQQPSKRARRTFLVAAAATVAVPTPVSSQQPMTWRFQSTWPAGEFHDYALDFARVVNEVTAGKLKIEMLPAGAVVPAFNVLDAVHRGTIDGSHTRMATSNSPTRGRSNSSRQDGRIIDQSCSVLRAMRAAASLSL